MLVCLAPGRAESYVQFDFNAPASATNPFGREINADVHLPDGQVCHVPAFFLGARRFGVRVNARLRGEYALGAVTETAADGRVAQLSVSEPSPARVTVRQANSLPSVGRDPSDPQRFQTSDGRKYVPLGVNLAWAQGAPDAYYERQFSKLRDAGLNWSRVWFAHWAGQNLDWSATPEKQPARGELDLAVAQLWDRVIAQAEANGIYLQLVLQHHGQYSSRVDANWAENPWNTANGGFLRTPAEFFTSDEARRLTRLKYRYIVARWGYSPAVLAWELFNEAHYTDALGEPGHEAEVAAWHREMAAFLRQVDAHRHLVITSLQDLDSPVYSSMDYVQPHLYVANMFAGVRRIRRAADAVARAAFYGEVGDDRMLLEKPQYDSAIALVPIVWSSLGGESTHPAQIWYGDRLLDAGRARELGALGRILESSGFGAQRALVPFSPAVADGDVVPLVLSGGHWWEKRAPAEIRVPTDGSEPAAYADIPRAFSGSEESRKEGYPGRVTLRVRYERDARVRMHFSDAGEKGAHLQVRVDEAETARHLWPALPEGQAPAPRPADVAFEVAAGEHVVVLENAGGPDAFILDTIDLGLPVPALAAVGRRNDRYVLLWVWHRTGVLSLQPGAAARAVFRIPDLPAGRWTLTWWDSLSGARRERTEVRHPGGEFRLAAPPIAAQAAATLVRAD